MILTFDLSSKELDDDSRIITVEVGDNVVGIIVDSVSEVLRLSTSNVGLTPEIISTKIQADYLKGVDKLDECLLILLDIKRVSNDDEMTQVETVSEMHG